MATVTDQPFNRPASYGMSGGHPPSEIGGHVGEFTNDGCSAALCLEASKARASQRKGDAMWTLKPFTLNECNLWPMALRRSRTRHRLVSTRMVPEPGASLSLVMLQSSEFIEANLYHRPPRPARCRLLQYVTGGCPTDHRSWNGSRPAPTRSSSHPDSN